MPRGRVFCLIQGIAVAASLLPVAARAQGVLHDGFESLETSWQVSHSDVRHRIETHERAQQQPHSGQWCEHVKLSGDNGSFVYMSQPVGESRIISELVARVWLRSDRPGLQLLARVVLPRTIDPSTNRPATMLVPGDSYTKVGIWQQLAIRELPLRVERQTRVLRTTLGPGVDAREAFVDQLVLNVYGGPGITSVWIDDLEITGVVARTSVANGAMQGNGEARLAASETPLPERLPATWEATNAADNSVPEVRLQGNVLLVGGKPFFPRMVHYRGEPLELLKRLGFNVVRVPTLPTIELLDEARRHDLWLVAQPPPAADLTTRNASGAISTIGRDFDRVLAWNLGGGLTRAELDVVRPWVKALRSADPRRRPIFCEPDSDLRLYSRHIDVLMVERRPLGTSLELNEYGIWLRSRTQLARPGTPVWTTIQTQPSPQLIEQLALLSNGQPPRLGWQHEQLRLLVITALAAGMRGICFESLTPLDTTDAETQERAAILELLNLELALLEPWTSSGVYVTTAECSGSQLVGVVLQTERARLLLPLAIAPQNQFAIDHGAAGAVSFTVPGASESNDAFEMSPAGLRPLVHRRVAGGLRITLGDSDRWSPIVITQDPLVTTTLSRKATQLGRRMFELQRGLNAGNLAQVADVDRRLAAIGRSLPQNTKLLETARQRLSQCESIAGTNDLPVAEERARQATLALRQIERAQWAQAMSALVSPLASAFALSCQTLPEHWQFMSVVQSSRRGPNRLRGGDCESLETMLGAGWKHMQHPQEGIVTSVELAAERPHSGQLALRMRAIAEDQKQKPEIIETPPMWVTSAPVYLEPGELVEITGFTCVPKRIEGSVDGLLILDSISGDALAERICVTHDWQQFTLYRVAPQSGNLTITFALTGFGEAWIDDVKIQAVDRGAANPQATRLPAAGSTVPSLR
jgi:hypothetical protein